MESTKIDIFLTVAAGFMVCMVLFVAFLAARHRNRALKKEAQLRALELDKQHAVYKSGNDAEEKQKELIGQHIHDTIIGELSATERSIGANLSAYGTSSFDFERLKNDREHIAKSIDTLRSITHELVPKTLLTLGLSEAVKEFVGLLSGTNGVTVLFDDSTGFTEPYPFSMEDQLNLYRMCLELLNNLGKHAQYTKLTVTFKTMDDVFEIAMMHNGTGVTNEQIELYAGGAGLGLRSIKSKALVLKARVNYSITPRFSLITITVPLIK